MEKEQEKDSSQTTRDAGEVEGLSEGILSKEQKKTVEVCGQAEKRE
ncbi:MAG: hypothetical protein KC587_12235 [Nitrospira sp.]|nr:hypothetical protein [Nitrospira sp.]